MGTERIKTKRLILRQVEQADSEQMYSNWASDPEVTRYLTWPAHETIETTKAGIYYRMANYEKDDFYDWGIEIAETKTLIGTISVVRIDEERKVLELGYVIGKDWWHQGIMTEAVKAVTRFLFETTDVQQIEAWHDVNNPNSGKVLENAGFTFVRICNGERENNQGVVDSAVYYLQRS